MSSEWMNNGAKGSSCDNANTNTNHPPLTMTEQPALSIPTIERDGERNDKGNGNGKYDTPKTPQRRVGAEHSSSNDAMRILEHSSLTINENPLLLMPTIRSGEECNTNGNDNIPSRSHRYDAAIDYNIAQAWISSAPGRKNHSSNSSNGANHETQQETLEGFQDEYTDSLKNRKKNPFEGLRRNLFSLPSSGGLKSNLARYGDDHQEDEEDEHPQFADCSDGPSIPSTPPSTPEDLMDLSFHSGNDHVVEDSQHVQHSYGHNLICNGDSDHDEKKEEPANQHNTNGSYKAVASPTDNHPFLWPSNPPEQIPDEIVLDDDQQANMEDELLTGDGAENSVNIYSKIGTNPRVFRTPRNVLSRPSVIRAEDRQITPQSWHTPISMLPRASAYRNTSGGSRRTTSAPLSPGSRRSAKSEKYYHSYHTSLGSPSQPVPPFVVVRNSGSAIVTVKPKRTAIVTTSKQKKSKKPKTAEDSISEQFSGVEIIRQSGVEADCGCDGEEAKVWCRMWGRPVTIALSCAVLILSLVTVITSLVANRFQNQLPEEQQQQQLRPWAPTTLTPTVSPPAESSDLIFDANNGTDLDILWEGVVIRPYEGSQNPAARPTQPPRTYPPSTHAEVEIPTFAPTMLPDNFPDYVPTSAPFMNESEDHDVVEDQTSLQIPWNNYVIGLLSVESPDTFFAFSDATSPQFLALQWISVESARKGGSTAYSMDASLQRFALATVYFALGGLDGWLESDSWLSTVVPVCSWKGVTCDNMNTAVLSLDLASNNLSGTMPKELKLLKYLQVLDFSGNAISGSLPPEYSSLYELVELNLAGNLLTGSIPEEYGGYGNFELLKTLDVSHNGLEGRLPSQLGHLKSLETIQMCSNAMTGTIPSTFGSLKNLQSIKLGNNNLTGDLPGAMCDSNPLTRLFDCSIVCECCTSCCAVGEDCC